MNIEAGALKEQEKKKKDLEEKKLKVFKKQKEREEITKEYIKTEAETEENLHKLQDLIEQGVITKEQAEHIAQGDELTNEDIQEIFDKIDEIEELKDIDTILPKDLRITKEDYIKATTDDIFRVQTITKLDSALVVLGQQINPNNSAGVNIFSGFLTVLDKNLIKVQEHNIDMKNNLKKIDSKGERESFGDIIKSIFK